MMTELHQFMQAMKQPEYVHVLLNPLPLYGTGMGVLALLIGLVMRSKPAQVLALLLVVVGCGSVWPVVEYGEQGEDRVKSMADADGREWLEAHGHRADIGAYVFYATAVLAAVALLTQWKFPNAAVKLTAVTLLAGLICLATGAWISHAGGQIRHREFRNGPPPVTPPEKPAK
jgi:hypothetical protein